MAGFFVVAAVAAPGEPPTMARDDETFESACSVAEWPKVARSLQAAAGGRRPSALVALGRTYLCERGQRADAIVRSAAARRLAAHSEGTGQDAVRRHERRDTLQAQSGLAWTAVVEQDDRGRVVLSFDWNEACNRNLTFDWTGSAWRIVARGEACD